MHYFRKNILSSLISDSINLINGHFYMLLLFSSLYYLYIIHAGNKINEDKKL